MNRSARNSVIAEAATGGGSRAVIYLRVSTEDQADTDYNAEGYSLPAQREACHRAADQLGAAVVDEYIDRGESAKSANRPHLQAMLARLREQRDIDYVIVHKVDRLARSRQDDIEITVAIRQAGAALVSATENIDETPSGKLMHGIMATIAEFYSQNLAAEAKKGARQKAKVGGTPYKPPIGYLTARERIEGREIRTVAVDSERAPLVRWAFKAYASGDYTLRELTEELEERGLRYEPTKKLPARPMTQNAVNWMLTNRYYVGLVQYEGSLYPGRHESLVDEATFEAVQAIMEARRVSGEKPQKRPHYLKGRLYCGACGTRMGISHSRSNNGTVYPYFYCIGRQKKRTNCQQTFAPVAAVEAAAVAYWKRWVKLDEEQSAAIRQVVMTWMLNRQGTSGKTISAQRTRIEKLERERDKLTQAYLADALPVEILKREQERVQRELGSARAIIEQHQADYASVEEALDHALLLCRVGAVAYEHAEPEVRRQLVQAAFEKLWIIGDEIAGCDLNPGFTTVLDDDLAAALASDMSTEGPEWMPEDQPEPQSRRLPVERPAGQFPWEDGNSASPGVPGVNISGRVALPGLKLKTPVAAYLRQCEESIKQGQALAAWSSEPAGALGRPDWRVRDRLPEPAVADLVARFVAGGSLKELARRYGINRTSIRRILREHGVLPEHERAPVT